MWHDIFDTFVLLEITFMKVLHNMEIKIRATYGQHSLGVKCSHRIGFQIIGYYKNIFT